MKYQRIRDAGEPRVLLGLWGLFAVVAAGLSAWLSLHQGSFLSVFIAWLLAFAFALVPFLAAFSVAGVLSAAIHRTDRYELSLIVFVLLAVSLCFGAVLARAKIPMPDAVSQRHEAIIDYLAKRAR